MRTDTRRVSNRCQTGLRATKLCGTTRRRSSMNAKTAHGTQCLCHNLFLRANLSRNNERAQRGVRVLWHVKKNKQRDMYAGGKYLVYHHDRATESTLPVCRRKLFSTSRDRGSSNREKSEQEWEEGNEKKSGRRKSRFVYAELPRTPRSLARLPVCLLFTHRARSDFYRATLDRWGINGASTSIIDRVRYPVRIGYNGPRLTREGMKTESVGQREWKRKENNSVLCQSSIRGATLWPYFEESRENGPADP